VRRLQNLEPLLDAKIKYVPPLILDNLAVDLGPWSGYHLLAQHLPQELADSAGSGCFHCVGWVESKPGFFGSAAFGVL